MLNQRFTIKRDFDNFSKKFPEMVVGASFTVSEEIYNGNYLGMTKIQMDSGTVYDIDELNYCWCFFTDEMVGNYLTPDKNSNKLIQWERREKELIQLLETHRKNKPIF